MSEKDKTIHISKSTHDKAKKITKDNGWNLGAFCDKAILKEVNSSTKTPLELLNTNYLLANGWEKKDGAYFDGNGNCIQYTGTYWLFNDIRITEDNFEEKLNTKTPDV